MRAHVFKQGDWHKLVAAARKLSEVLCMNNNCMQYWILSW